MIKPIVALGVAIMVAMSSSSEVRIFANGKEVTEEYRTRETNLIRVEPRQPETIVPEGQINLSYEAGDSGVTFEPVEAGLLEALDESPVSVGTVRVGMSEVYNLNDSRIAKIIALIVVNITLMALFYVAIRTIKSRQNR